MTLGITCKDSLSDILGSVIHAGKYSQFIRGVNIDLPTGQQLTLKIEKVERLPSPIGFFLYRHRYLVEMSAGEIVEYGCAEADTLLLALEKSISEAAERVLFRVLKGSGHGTPNSNGWAAHVDRKRAEKSGLLELLERDAALVHWLNHTPWLEIDPASSPKWLLKWTQNHLAHSSYPILRILIAHLGHAPTVSTAFLNQDGKGVISHAGGSTLESALLRALAETGRLARMAISQNYVESSRELLISQSGGGVELGPHEHAVTYAHHLPVPEWIFGEKQDWKVAAKNWQEHWDRFSKNPIRYQFHEILSAPISVGFCTSPDIQNLYFGRTQDAMAQGVLSLDRLARVKSFNPGGKLNELPHFVA